MATRLAGARRKPNRTRRNRQSRWEFIPSGSSLESRLQALLRSSADRTVGEILAQTSRLRRNNMIRKTLTANASPAWPKPKLRRAYGRLDASICIKNEDTLSSGNLQGDKMNLIEISSESAKFYHSATPTTSITATLTPTLTPTSTSTPPKTGECVTDDFHSRCAAVVAECNPGFTEVRSASQMSEGLELLLAASQSASLDMTPTTPQKQ